MSLKSRLLKILKQLTGDKTAKTSPKRTTNAAVNVSERIISGKPRRSQSVPPAALDFNLTEAVRLRTEGLSNRRIARKMNCSKDTVRTRLRDYDAAHAKPAAPKPTPSVSTPPEPPPSVTPEPPPSSLTLQPQQPVTNIPELVASRRSKYGDKFPADLTHVFLVRPPHVPFALGSEQPCIGFERWRPEYRNLAMFKEPIQFYVLIVAEDGRQVNHGWLTSIARDIWIAERCLVLRVEHGNALPVFQARYHAQHDADVNRQGAHYGENSFMSGWKFLPCPQPNHVLQLDALAFDAVRVAEPQPVAPLITRPEDIHWLTPAQEARLANGEAAGGLVTGGDDKDAWK